MTDTDDPRPLSAETIVAEALRAAARRYGMAPGNDAIDYFPDAEVWARRIVVHLANHGYGFIDSERARHAALVAAARRADSYLSTYRGRAHNVQAARGALRAALDGELRGDEPYNTAGSHEDWDL